MTTSTTSPSTATASTRLRRGPAARKRPTPPGTAGKAPRWKGQGAPWLLMAPAMIVLLLMTVVPALYLLRASFRNDTLLGGGGGWVGLENYVFAVTDPVARSSLLITVGFVVVAVAVQTLLGLLLALPMAKQSRSNTLATGLLLLPFAVTPAVSALIFRELFNPNYGWVNHYLERLGLPGGTEWLSNPPTAWFAILALDVWQWTPFVALILIAGLQSLPAEPLEAAAVDGASRWQTFRHVVLPQLGPFLAIAVVLRTIQAFKTFDSFKVLTNGGPGESTEIINLGIYRVALQSFRVGAASATAVLLLILLSLLVPALLRVVGRSADPEEA